ncbi:MAG: tRNA(Ile)-lysidine synthase [Candidatus Dependentiae bacterium]|nr:tRNA(Ile)-lysidine synthase [Candidatus Dependentiae bacterium]
MLIKKVQDRLLQLTNTIARPKILLGLSGGADSVFLFRALAPLHEMKLISLDSIHINHGWRDTADNDMRFCAQLVTFQHRLSLILEETKSWADKLPAQKKNSGSKEADAREIRRFIFEHYRHAWNYDVIALAHHADDQIETFFIRLIRGSGLTGLCAMQEKQDHLVRPLLTISKAEILTWLKENNQEFCHDETNDSMAFLRNRIRAKLTPALAACDERATQSLLRTIAHLQQEETLLTYVCAQTIDALKDENEWYKIKEFFECAPALRVRILTTLLIKALAPFTPSESLFAEIERFLASPNGGSHEVAPSVTIHKKKRSFYLQSA